MPRTVRNWVPILDRTAGPSLPSQIAAAVRRDVGAGTLRPGEPLPSSRVLARRLAVSRGSVESAYDQLLAEGYVLSRARSGTFVNPQLRTPAPVPTSGTLASRPNLAPPAPLIDLTPGHDTNSPLDDPAWRASWRRAADPGHGLVHRPIDPMGAVVLREAVAEHLRLMRGLMVDPARVVVTAGSRDGLALLLTALSARGARPRVGVEDPGFPGLRATLRRRGIEMVLLPVDDAGLVVPRDDGNDGAPGLVLVTPNHQFPYGSAMPATRRTQLLDWASTRGTLIVEDDYDSEFRYVGPPSPALYGLVPGAPVVHLGTFSGVLSRDVGTGYLLLPDELVHLVTTVRADLGCPVAPILQRAVAGYLSEGGLRRRLQRSRRRLLAAQDLVAQSMESIPGAVDRGRMLVIEGPPALATTLRQACLDRGVLLGDLAHGWSRSPDNTGVVLAYGSVTLPRLGSALSILQSVLGGLPTDVSGTSVGS